METLCFESNYRTRFARVKEFYNEKIEIVLDEFLRQFSNMWLEEEYSLQSGAARYERTEKRTDKRQGHYTRTIITGRGIIELFVPRGKNKQYTYTLFEKFKRKTKHFEDIVADAIIKGHSSRKASRFFGKMFGKNTISHEAAVNTLRRFDSGLEKWKNRPLPDNPLILVLDGVWLKGAIRHLTNAKPVLFAYAIYADGSEDVLDFEIEQGEFTNAWTKFCQRLYERGIKEVKLIVHFRLRRNKQRHSIMLAKSAGSAMRLSHP